MMSLLTFFACDELAVVEPCAVVEKQLYGRSDDHVAVAVGPRGNLLVDLAEAVYDRAAFLGRDMESLVDGIGKECIVFHLAHEGGTAQEFWTEVKTPAFCGEHGAVGRMAEHLSRTHEHESVFLSL